jgi:hypothetical protein
MATARFRLVSVALHTSPMPPTPIWVLISYGPMRVPGVRANPRGLQARDLSADGITLTDAAVVPNAAHASVARSHDLKRRTGDRLPCAGR